MGGVVQELITNGATNLETALDDAKRSRRTDVVQLLEKRIVDDSVTRPLQLFGSMDSTTVIVTCTNMVGKEMAQFTVDPEMKFNALVDLVREQLPLQIGRWTLILPSGE